MKAGVCSHEGPGRPAVSLDGQQHRGDGGQGGSQVVVGWLGVVIGPGGPLPENWNIQGYLALRRSVAKG